MARYEVREFGPDALPEAARLLSERHRQQRRTTLALDLKYEQADACQEQIEALLTRDDASGAIVLVQGRALAFVLGTRRSDSPWGPNVWVESAGMAGTDVEAVREAYALAAGRWVDEGRTSHYVIVPASSPKEIEAWFSLGFGRQHVHALREPVWREFEPALADGLAVRQANRADIPMLAELDRELPRHQAGSPVFSRLPPLSVEQARADIESEFADPRYTTFVAENDEGRVIGAAVACSIELSPGNTGLMRPRSAGLLGFAAVLPDARGLGAGRALGETVMAWCRDEGYEWVAVDWRSTNLLSNRAWLALGFRPSFYRLHRAVV